MFLSIDIDEKCFSKKCFSDWFVAETSQYFTLTNKAAQSTIRLRQRTDYPQTYATTAANGTYTLGYGVANTTNYNFDFLHITLSEEALVISRDALVTLPIYYVQIGSRLLVSNDYAALAQQLPHCTVNRPHLLRNVLLAETSTETPLQEIHSLGERHNLTFTSTGIHLTTPPNTALPSNDKHTETDPRLFRKVFEETMEDFYVTCLHGQPYAFEASGGLDSSTLPLFLAVHIPEKPFLTTMLLPDEAGRSQRVKLEALHKSTELPVAAVNIDKTIDFPLAQQISTQQFKPFTTTDAETIATVLTRYTEQLRRHGITVLATGNGGDDIMEHFPTQVSDASPNKTAYNPIQAAVFTDYVTEEARQTYQRHIEQEKTATPLFPVSMQGQNVVNNAYIEAGIWPVSPFMNYELYQYCQGLPAYMRHNKNILRAYYQVRHFPSEIYVPEKSESSLPFLNEFFVSDTFMQLVQRFLVGGFAEQLGYINMPKLLEVLKRERANPTNSQTLFQIYQTVAAEISLQSTPNISL